MAKGRRTFDRALGERRYRKMFVVSVEGLKTEPQYFAVFNGSNSIVRVNTIPGSSDSSPHQVLKRMRTHLRKEGLRASDEAWLVVDKDQWTVEQLDELYAWSQESERYGFALSNPKFEFWLLLHFDDGAGATTAAQCELRLRRWLPAYDKGVSAADFPRDRVEQAVARARRRDTPQCQRWPSTPGVTTVYRLVERILTAGEG
jgi:hypothetical protein